LPKPTAGEDSLEARSRSRTRLPSNCWKACTNAAPAVGGLERNKVSQIAPPAGTKFDPHQHQAISVVRRPGGQHGGGRPAEGLPHRDRVLRPALVTVAAAK